MARRRALTRRVGRDGQLRCGALYRDPASGVFYNEALPLDLSQREAELLRLLMSRIDRVVSKEELRTQVFADTGEQVQADAVEVVVHRLRKKLVGTNAEIVTLRGVGYLLCHLHQGDQRHQRPQWNQQPHQQQPVQRTAPGAPRPPPRAHTHRGTPPLSDLSPFCAAMLSASHSR